ncbi:Protein of unknown function [Bacillus mobilis]|nr:Protein of unknown function [Bacillus mobilis]
MVYVIS